VLICTCIYAYCQNEIDLMFSVIVDIKFMYDKDSSTELNKDPNVQGFIKFKMSMFYICLHCCCPAFCCICMVLFMKSLRTPTGQPEVPLLCHSSTIVLSVGIVFQCLIPYCCMYAVINNTIHMQQNAGQQQCKQI
jgi:hypothetical protein